MTEGLRSAISRRVLLTGLAATVGSAIATAEARRRVVYLGTLRRDQAPGLLEALEEGLRSRGYHDGTLAFEVRVADGRPEQLPDLAVEVVRMRPDVIVAGVNAEVAAAKRATRTIPIVMVIANDPVGAQLVASLGRPGGNVTGLTLDVTADTWGKRLELLVEMAGPIDRVALVSGSQVPNREAFARASRKAAAALGVTVVEVVLSAGDELSARFAAMSRDGVSGMLLFPDPVLYRERVRIVTLAVRYKLRTMYPLRQFAEAGGLLSYGPDITDQYRRAAGYVDRLLKGARAEEFPVEQPTKFELVVNARTLRAHGLELRPALRLRADHVIE